MSSPHPTVLVVHGALGSAAQMQPIVDALAESGRFARVVAVDLPGHGHTPADAGFDMAAFTSALAATMQHHELERPLVFGYSMGGYVALLLESQSPGMLRGLVTLGTMMHWTPDVAERAASRLDPDAMRAKVPAFAAVLEERHAGAGGWERVLSNTATLLRQLGAAPPLTDTQLRAIACPTHLLVGGKDDTVTLEETTHAASHIPHARASLLEGVPHPIERVPVAVIVREVCDLLDLITGS